jgi:hypothetical protein
VTCIHLKGDSLTVAYSEGQRFQNSSSSTLAIGKQATMAIHKPDVVL